VERDHKLVQLALDLIGNGVGTIARLHLFPLPSIFCRVPLRVAHIRSISSFDSWVVPLIVILCSLPVFCRAPWP